MAPDPLDRCMASYEVRERHSAVVHAPASVTYAAALDVRLDDSWLVRMIFRAREFCLRARMSPEKRPPLSIRELSTLGWRAVIEEPEQQIVFAAVTRPWEARPSFIGLSLEDFTRFQDPGYVKIAWTVRVEPLDAARSLLSTETRVSTTDETARRRFRLYWAAFAPGIRIIRREMLRLTKAEARARWSKRGRDDEHHCIA